MAQFGALKAKAEAGPVLPQYATIISQPRARARGALASLFPGRLPRYAATRPHTRG